MGKGDLVPIGGGAIYVVKPDRHLRHHFKFTFAGAQHLFVDGIAQGSDQSIDTAMHSIQDQLFGRRLRMRINLDFAPVRTQSGKRIFSYVTSGKYLKTIRHCQELSSLS
jgi:hypothetical protein